MTPEERAELRRTTLHTLDQRTHAAGVPLLTSLAHLLTQTAAENA